MPVCDGWEQNNQPASTITTANIIHLGLPPELRKQPELMFNWFGISGKPSSDLNAFVRLALQPFIQCAKGDCRAWVFFFFLGCISIIYF